MSKTVDNFTVQRVTYETTLPVATVLTRLDDALGKGKVDPLWWKALAKASSREEVEAELQKINGGKDFTAFSTLAHHLLTNVLRGGRDAPETHLYTFGNPLLAQDMLQHDRRAGLHVPPRLLILEKADRTGTQIIYILPSSLIMQPGGGEAEEFGKLVARLDEKLEKTVLSCL